MTDVLSEVMAVLESDSVKAAMEFADKRLVDGKLLVTPRQFSELQRWATDVEPGQRQQSHWSDIPVQVVEDDGLAHPIGNGRYAVVTDHGIYVFTPPPTIRDGDTGKLLGLPFVADASVRPGRVFIGYRVDALEVEP